MNYLIRSFLLSSMAVLLLLLAGPATAQGIRATVTGRVTDAAGAVVPQAKITITNTGTNVSRVVETNENGEYTLPQLSPGDYRLAVEKEGFKKTLQRITLETGQGARIDLVLTAGELSDQVEVSAITPVMSLEDASLGNVVDQKKIVELPLNGRSYLQLALLQPNVFAPAQNSTLGFRGGFNVAGNSEIANNYILDGIDNNDETTNQPSHQPILDGVREFKVLTGTYSAEYGRQAGGQVIVTSKSGSNQFHGSAFEFHRNAALDAKNYFITGDKPSFRRNQYGGVLGGPILHDKMFFFTGYEGQRRGQQEAGLTTVPTEKMRIGDFSELLPSIQLPFAGNQIPQELWSSQGKGLLDLFPLPTGPGVNNNYNAVGTGRFSVDQFSARLDRKWNNHDLFGSYQFADSTEYYPITNPLCSARDVSGWGCDEMQRTQHFSLNWTWTINPYLVNEARIGYSRFGFYRLQEDRDADVIDRLGIKGLDDAGVTAFNNGAPQLSLTGYPTIGGATNLPQGRHDNTYHYVENMTWINGSHTMKWGMDIRRFLYNSFFTSFGRGAFSFDGRYAGYSVADLLLGAAFRGERNLGEPFHNAMTFSSGFYFQDDWKVSPNLTLNLGLRYELNLPPIEKVDKIASFDPDTNTIKVAGGREAFINPANGLLEMRARPDVGRRLWETDKNNFAPRIGLAWRPWGGTKTVIRAGFRTFYNLQIVGNGITPLSRNSPFRQRETAGPFPASGPLPDIADIFSGNPTVVPPGIEENFRTAYINQWSFGVQRELAESLVLDVSYLGSQGHKLPLGVNINQPLPGPSAGLNARRPYPGFGDITGGFIESAGNSNYHGMTVRVERRFTRGLSFLSSYAWSKSIDDGAGISTGSDSSGIAQNVRNLRAERALSDFDVEHRWVLSFVYDLPFGNRYTASNRVANFLVSGWQLTGIYTLQSGRPFTVTTGADRAGTGVTNTDRPNIIGDWRLSDPSPDRWFNACTLLADGRTTRNCRPGESPAWQQNAAGAFGNAGRNIIRGDGLNNFDFGISRFFKVKEGHQIQFRAEVFNLSNHPNFFFPTANLASGSFGAISRAANVGTGAQRQIQFALKYLF